MGNHLRRMGIALVLVAACGWALPAMATTYTTVFSETFDGASLPTTLTYGSSPQTTWSINGANQLFCDYVAGANATVSARTIDGFLSPGDMVIYSLDVGVPEDASPGSYNVGIDFGSYSAVFHPGFTGAPPGAFRMGGGFSTGNIDMGFVPARGTMHHIEVVTQSAGSALAVDVSVTGLGTDSLMHTFNYSFLDTTPNLSTGTFGGRRSGGGNSSSDALYDNFRVQISPEPATMAMLAGGLLALVRRRRRA